MGDLFLMLTGDKLLLDEKIIPDMSDIRAKWNDTVKGVLEEASLKMPENSFMMMGGRKGKHSEHLGFILAELQFLPRAYPDAKW